MTRANPRISGNVKITVDSKKDIWLNSIDSNSEMSNQAYKGFRINEGSSYDKDLYNFFKEGATPLQSVFGLSGEGDPVENQIGDLAQTYDFTYAAGVTPLISDKYTENYSYLAPFWMGDDIPDYFVLFKINDPIDYLYQVPVTSLTTAQSYKVVQDNTVNTSDPSYLPYQITSGTNTYSSGDIFTATSTTFTVIQGQGSIILLDPLYHLADVENSDTHFRNKILPKSTAIATYDLSENSKIGKYLRNIQNNPGYTPSLIDARFEENQLTTYNGVNYRVGIFDKKGDYYFDYFSSAETQIGFEDFITDGFRKNGIISYKLLNLEFLFNDTDSKDYSINRYFGLFVNAPEMSSFRLDGDALYKNQGLSGNTPIPPNNTKGYAYQETSYYQYNENGVRLFMDSTEISGVIPNSDSVNITESNKLFWIQDKNLNFYSLKRDENYTNPLVPSTSIYGKTGSENEIVIQNNKVDLSLFSGINPNTKKQYAGVSTGEKGRAYCVVRIGGQLDVNYEDAFIFYNPLGYYGPIGARYDIIKVSDLSSLVDEWGPGSFYAQDNAYYIHPFGTPDDIAKALTGVLNNFPYNSFEAFQSGDEVLIRIKATGAKENNKYHLDFYQMFSTLQRMPDSRRGNVLINEKDTCDINQKQSFVGGSDHYVTRVKVKIEDANKIEVGKTYLETIKNTSTDTFTGLAGYTNKSASLVVGKYRFVDEYSRNANSKIIGIKDFETHATLEMESYIEKVSLGSIGKISAFNIYDIPVGIFSFYGLRELDMDFWDSQYGYTPTEEYFRHLDTQPDGVTIIEPYRSYYIATGAEITYLGNNLTGPDFFAGMSSQDYYTLVKSSDTAESNVYPTISSRGSATGDAIFYLSPLTGSAGGYTLFDNNFYPDLDAFPGFYGIQGMKFINNANALQTKNSDLLFGKLYSEYDYTQDNYNSKFAIKSRVSPYITKWSYNGGTDIRGNEYRLNSNIAFSPLNFSPSFFRRNQDPQYFTHEWYQLSRVPYSFPSENLFFDKSYLADNRFPFISNLYQVANANPASRDYFLDYFSIDGPDLGVDSVNFTERYSIFDFNKGSGFPETLFRGAKTRIKKLFTDYTQGKNRKFTKEDRFFDSYKFSCVIIPIRETAEGIQSPLKIRILENRTFKTITFVVEILFDDARGKYLYGNNGKNKGIDLDYFLLYSLKDKISNYDELYAVDAAGANVPYFNLPNIADVKLSSALNVSPSPNDAGLFSVVTTSTGNNGKIYSIPNADYETDLREEINLTYLSSTVPVSSGVGPTPGSVTGPGSFYGTTGSSSSTTLTYNFPFPIGIGEDYINFRSTNLDYYFDFTEIGTPSAPPLPDIPISTSVSVVKDIAVWQRSGGENYWRNIMEKFSFANISLMVNTGNPYIEYKSYVWNETTKTTDILDNQFSLEFLKPSAFQQNSIILTEEDTNKPDELFPFFIGYNTKEVDGTTELYRYSGEYIPKFRDVLRFENVKNDLPDWILPSKYTNTYPTFNVTISEKNIDSINYDLGSEYCISIDSVLQKEIVLVRGVKYIFDNSDASNLGYQFYLSETNIGNSYPSDALLEGFAIFGTPGTIGSTIELDVPYNFPDDVYYVAQGGKYMGQKIKVIDPIEYSFCTFGPSKYEFGKLKNTNYYKYGENWIFRIGKNSPYDPLYNLIGETPVDKRDLSLFESSWDPGFYRQYSAPQTYIDLPGTRGMMEKKSFFGSKVMQTPDMINSQKQLIYPTSMPDALNINYDNFPNYEIFWEETQYELRGVLLMDRMVTRYFLNNGGKKVFDKFIVPEFGFGDQSINDDDFNEYMKLNVVPRYQSKNNGTYLKKIPVQNGASLPQVIGNLADYEKLINGYLPSQNVKYTKVNELRYEFTIDKDPGFNYSIAFSIRIGKI